MAQKTMSWVMPSTYEDGTPIDPADIQKIAIRVFRDGAHVYTTIDGATSWPIEVQPGVTNVWTLVAVLNGKESQPSAPYTYTLPFPTPNPPDLLSIT